MLTFRWCTGLRSLTCGVQPYEPSHPYLPAYMNPELAFSGRRFGKLVSVCSRFLMYAAFLRLHHERWDQVTDERLAGCYISGRPV